MQNQKLKNLYFENPENDYIFLRFLSSHAILIAY
jgi:hypothetical protein